MARSAAAAKVLGEDWQALLLLWWCC